MSPETVGVEVLERSAILEHITGLAEVGITSEPLMVVGQEERGGVRPSPPSGGGYPKSG